jgi:glutamate racemase
LSGDKLGNDLQRILKQLKNYDSMLLVCTHYPATETEIKKHLKPSCQLLDPVYEMVEWVQ